jgi:hypothetical protein
VPASEGQQEPWFTLWSALAHQGDVYFAALAQLPSLVATAGPKEWDEHFLVCALSAIAAAKGFPTVAEAAQELTPRVAAEFLEWLLAR